jgi:hypothetical protein
MHCFRVLKFWSFHSTPLDKIDVCECFGSFRWPSTGKRWKLVFGDWMHCFRVLKLWSIHSTLLDTIDVCECFGSFLLPSTGKRWKTCVWGLNARFRGTKFVKHPFYFIGPKMTFEIVSEYFTNLRQVKRCKTCVSGLNALFQVTEVVKHPFYSIGHNWCLWVFGSFR